MRFLNGWFDPRARHVLYARRYLEKQGIAILDESVVTSRGKVDLVGLDRQTLVLAAVRLRGCPDRVEDDSDVACPAEIKGAAEEWLALHPGVHAEAIRLDVVRLDWYAKQKGGPVLRYFPDAVPIGSPAKLMETTSP